MQQGAGSSALTVSLALAVGIVVQSVGRHMRIPGIVLLLAAGVALGPDGLGFIEPRSLGDALSILVGFAVAVILFEGGMNLNLTRLRQQATPIRRLLTYGAAITMAGGALSARYILGWDWSLSVLFGSLVIVTGPTVVTPLLRRIKVHPRVETILEGEAVLIDAIGAVVAVVTLEVVLGQMEAGYALAPVELLTRLGFGLALGVLGGLLLALVLRFHRLVPDDLENVFTLALVLALFQLSNEIIPESGIMSVTAAGMVVGNVRTRVHKELLEFKEQLTVLLIGMLFVLLAADVRLADVTALGWPGVLTVLALMFVVRPVQVAVCTLGSDLNLREKAFIAWLAPRGIVAAAVASLFAESLSSHGVPGGNALRALVFMVIGFTVLIQGLTGGLVASLLGLRRERHRGTLILGAHELGHVMGRLLRKHGEEVVFLDSDPHNCRIVEEDGFQVIYGNPVEERTLERARVDEYRECLAMTLADETNLLFTRLAIGEFKARTVLVALRRGQELVRPAAVHEAGAYVLFGRPRDLELWALRCRRDLVVIEGWVWQGEPKEPQATSRDPLDVPENLVLPLLIRAGRNLRPASTLHTPKKGDPVVLGLFQEKLDEAREWLKANGWAPAPLEADAGSPAEEAPAAGTAGQAPA